MTDLTQPPRFTITGRHVLVAFVLFFVIKLVMGLRVSQEEEVGGLDIGEHGSHAYPDFQSIAEK
jgi:Amt family ammonium transporter